MHNIYAPLPRDLVLRAAKLAARGLNNLQIAEKIYYPASHERLTRAVEVETLIRAAMNHHGVNRAGLAEIFHSQRPSNQRTRDLLGIMLDEADDKEFQMILKIPLYETYQALCEAAHYSVAAFEAKLEKFNHKISSQNDARPVLAKAAFETIRQLIIDLRSQMDFSASPDDPDPMIQLQHEASLTP